MGSVTVHPDLSDGAARRLSVRYSATISLMSEQAGCIIVILRVRNFHLFECPDNKVPKAYIVPIEESHGNAPEHSTDFVPYMPMPSVLLNVIAIMESPVVAKAVDTEVVHEECDIPAFWGFWHAGNLEADGKRKLLSGRMCCK
jgi:hypothetical protein